MLMLMICDSYTLLRGYVQEQHQGALLQHTYTVNTRFCWEEIKRFLNMRLFTSAALLPKRCAGKTKTSSEADGVLMRAPAELFASLVSFCSLSL